MEASVERAGPALRREELDGLAFWSAADELGASAALRSPVVRLVQGYDEYIMGYTETKRVLVRPGAAWEPAARPVSNLVVLLDGRVAGFWKRVFKSDVVVVEAALETFGAASMPALEAEAARYGEFVGLDALLRIVESPGRRGGEA